MIKEAVILAGGLGTRLRSVVSGLPKCMAPVAGKPFLHYVVEHLKKQGIYKFIFSVGYKSEAIIEYISTQYPMLTIQYSIENEPLGTGGAIKFAASKATEASLMVLNGDTLFSVDTNKLSSLHDEKKADCTLSLKPMIDFERYGVVELKEDLSIASFKEKKFYAEGLINGGVYALQVESFLKEDLPEIFSFEKEYLERFYSIRKMYGLVQDKYFIDIGIPEDYERAQRELVINN